MHRKLLTAVGALLVGFHVWLFAGQAWGGELADVSLLGRWALAGGLVWALARLRRQGDSVLWSRKAVSIWLLAVLLHGPAVVERFSASDLVAAPEVVATVVQIGFGALATSLALLLGALLVRRRPPVSHRWRLASRRLAPCRPASGWFVFAAPRPPPIA